MYFCLTFHGSIPTIVVVVVVAVAVVVVVVALAIFLNGFHNFPYIPTRS